MQYHISKSYNRTIGKDGNFYKFSTSLSKDADVKSAEDLTKENEKLFEQCKILTDLDIKRHYTEIFGQS